MGRPERAGNAVRPTAASLVTSAATGVRPPPYMEVANTAQSGIAVAAHVPRTGCVRRDGAVAMSAAVDKAADTAQSAENGLRSVRVAAPPKNEPGKAYLAGGAVVGSLPNVGVMVRLSPARAELAVSRSLAARGRIPRRSKICKPIGIYWRLIDGAVSGCVGRRAAPSPTEY